MKERTLGRPKLRRLFSRRNRCPLRTARLGKAAARYEAASVPQPRREAADPKGKPRLERLV
jgi:hypothetical protein